MSLVSYREPQTRAEMIALHNARRQRWAKLPTFPDTPILSTRAWHQQQKRERMGEPPPPLPPATAAKLAPFEAPFKLQSAEPEPAAAIETEPHRPRKLTIHLIQNVVSDLYGITDKDITSKSRTLRITKPRLIAMYICNVLTNLSYPKIGHGFGYYENGFFHPKDHTTVLCAVRRIAYLMSVDRELADEISEIKSIIERLTTGASGSSLPSP